MIAKLLKMQLLGDDDDFAPTEKVKKRSTSDGRPSWMRTLLKSASNWQTIIPKVKMHSQIESLFNFFFK